MNEVYPILIPALIAFFSTCWIRPYILQVANEKNIVDNPNARKLQRVPVPLLGGLTVVFGILSGFMGGYLFGDSFDWFPVITSVIIILIVGFIDDTISLSPRVRFFIEIILVVYLIYTTGSRLNDFHGLWGLHLLSEYISVPLTVFACIGIINAINLIDGVDGYSSGYSIVSCVLFGAVFHVFGNVQMVILSAVVAASLLPFFVHNVFGVHSKMFIGDAGTLSLGIIFSVFVTTVLSGNSPAVSVQPNFGFVPFTLSVLCIPVFDTLRVMTARMFAGRSPFSPDKTHLHHLFIELGYSHIGTTVSIISMNLLVVLCWYLSYRFGFSIDFQLYVVVVSSVLMTFVFYSCVKYQIRKKSIIYRFLRRMGRFTHVERKGFWLFIQKWVDGETRNEDFGTN